MTQTYDFGAVVVRPEERRVFVDGQPAALGSRAFDLLLALIERRDRVVTKNELLDLVWPGLVVEENNLQVQVSALRKILGPEVLATIPGRGYQFSMALASGAPRGGAAETASRSGNLPAPCDELVGREGDIEAVAALLGVHRLVSVVGHGGIGKTRLAQEVARGQVDRFAQGVWWVDLATVDAKDKVAPAIAAAANVRLGPGDPVASLAEGLAARDTLLVLDNCEYATGHVATAVRAVMTAGPKVRILATSQELLKLPGEAVYPLATLEVPLPEAHERQAIECASLVLLERRAQALDPRFRLGSQNFRQAAELCRQLDGNALAIEMAAARLPVLGLTTLLDRLGERLRLLRTGNREAPSRYQTLKGTLDWSYSLLSADQQAVLRRLSVFVASFGLEAAQRVAAGDDLDPWAALDALATLVDKSLVQIEPVDPPRYRLLQTTRLYGLEHLEESGELGAALCRHGEAMAALGAQADVAFMNHPESRCLERYRPEYDDLQAAFEHACERRDPEVAGAVAAALTRIDIARGYYFMMRPRNDAAHSLVLGAGPLARARLWTSLASGRYIACPSFSRLSASSEEVAAWREIGDAQRICEALSRLAVVHATSGRPRQAEAALQEARGLADPGWPAPFRAFCAFHAAVVSAYSHDTELFRSRALALGRVAREAQSRRMMAVETLEMAEVLVQAGDYTAAIETSRRALDSTRGLGNPLGLGNVLSTYCNGLVCLGRLDDVPPIASEGVTLLLQCGVAGWIFDPLAWYAALRGRFEAAAQMLGFADAQFAAIQECRRPHDANAQAQAARLARGALGDAGFAALRAEGAEFSKERAQAVAAEVLADRFQEA